MKLESVIQPGADQPRSIYQAQHALTNGISKLEDIKAQHPTVVPSQFTTLRAYLTAVIAYLDLVMDIVAPTAPTATVNAVDGSEVTGTAEANSTVTVYAADETTVLGTDVADGAGAYVVPLDPALVAGETVYVTATDASGNVSASTAATAPTL